MVKGKCLQYSLKNKVGKMVKGKCFLQVFPLTEFSEHENLGENFDIFLF